MARARSPGTTGTPTRSAGLGVHTWQGHGIDRPSPEELEDLIALRRMRGGPFGGPGPFGRGGPRGRGRGRARRGDVRLALLRLLAEEPRNGYQLMQTIEERSGGRWRPSPGSVYPTLAQLEDEGLIRSTESDGGTAVRDHRRRPRAPRDPRRRAGSVGADRRGRRARAGRARPARDPDRQGRLAGRLGRRRAPARPRHRAAGRDPAEPVPDPGRGAGEADDEPESEDPRRPRRSREPLGVPARWLR